MKYTPRQYAIKIFWIVVNPIRHAYWFIVRPKTLGVKCLVENEEAFLLVRINYGHRRWTVPGGGIHKGEAPEVAAMRELKEEAGIVADKVRKIGEYTNTHQYKIDTVHVYHTRVPNRDSSIDGFEIAEAEWFTLAQLPKDRMPSVDRILTMRQETELRRATLIASTGVSTRLAGSKLSDKEVEQISKFSEQR